LLVDRISREDEISQETLQFAERLFSMPVIPEIASLIAFAFARKSGHFEAVEWLSKSNLSDPENSGLLLDTVANFRELADVAIEAFRS
jgi:hypothetical protein